ncbi:hypothetical protein BGL60_04610 [Helicobacter pylori]|nr:hypothetical protein BGL60_04610 [Helicobacter pylori]OPG65008.1 hypothetical protein BGL84_03930 [Helicobacter pylori]
MDLGLLYFWLYSNRILTAKVLFNLFKNRVLVVLLHRFRFYHYFLKRIRGYFVLFPPLKK